MICRVSSLRATSASGVSAPAEGGRGTCGVFMLTLRLQLWLKAHCIRRHAKGDIVPERPKREVVFSDRPRRTRCRASPEWRRRRRAGAVAERTDCRNFFHADQEAIIAVAVF